MFAALDAMLDDDGRIGQSAGLSRMESIRDVLCSIDSRNPTRTAEARSGLKIRGNRASLAAAIWAASSVVTTSNSVEYLPIDCQLRRIAALLVALAAASSEIEGKPRRAEMFAAARTPTSAMLTMPSTPPCSVTAWVSDSQSVRSIGKRVVGLLQAWRFRILVRD